jgi:hypothetical protein
MGENRPHLVNGSTDPYAGSRTSSTRMSRELDELHCPKSTVWTRQPVLVD